MTLLDLLELSVLQKFQNSFSKMTGMAALTTDENGKPVTEGSNFTEYCMEFTRKSKVGCERCEKCDRYGSEVTMQTGKAVTYVCHSGLIDFSAPIIANGEMVGCFIGGQVLTEKPDPDKIRQVAKEIGVDFEAYWEAIQKVPILPKEKIDAAADFLFEMSDVLSQMAYSKYMAIEAGREIERAGNLKSDFLANMSHEIRTPMNAVIGMAEMALREELTPAARNYINQIKSSGRALLNIINDILDISKIESGKMDIIPMEYEPLSFYNDVASIVSTRLKDKRVELILSVDPTFPMKILGDNLRVRQILINLANNAVKFTQKGRVQISIHYDKIDEDNILLKVSVKDTGIGIKKEDLEKIFDSFQQVDSKRNRNIEGTGLGLAISRNLIHLMDGHIHVTSEYEKGSCFSFEIPQKVLDWTPSITVKEVQNTVAIGCFNNKFIAKEFYRSMNKLGVYSIALISKDRLEKLLDTYREVLEGKEIHFFTEERCVDTQLKEQLEKHPEIRVYEFVDFYSERKSENEEWRVLRKPVSAISLALAMNGEEYSVETEDEQCSDFIAPDAKILIVDDNSINLTVAEGLMEPLQMKVYSTTSGKEAIELIGRHKFNLIFMDHMMPELDGVETTRLIRRFHPEYNEVPIIALTANAVEGTKEMFLSEGMNDFVPKPIEVRVLVDKIKRWLPVEMIKKGHVVVENTQGKKVESEEIIIGDLNTKEARKLLGNDELFWTVLKGYYKNIPNKSQLIAQYKQQKDWPNYTIEVHALKSTSKQIGAMELASLAAELEKAGNARDIETIKEYTDEMLQMYHGYLSILKPYCEEEKQQKLDCSISKEDLLALFDEMLEAVDNLDMDEMERISREMNQYPYEAAQQELMDQLLEAADNIDVDCCEETIQKWKALLG